MRERNLGNWETGLTNQQGMFDESTLFIRNSDILRLPVPAIFRPQGKPAFVPVCS